MPDPITDPSLCTTGQPHDFEKSGHCYWCGYAPRSRMTAFAWSGTLSEKSVLGECEAIRARPYIESVAHEYAAWETSDIEEQALDMLAVVRQRRAPTGEEQR